MANTVKQTYNKIARRLEQVLQMQAPIDTGRLKRSIAVAFDENGFVIYDPTGYGFYTHAGTGREAATSGDNPRTIYDALSNKKYNPNPGQGKGGIKPRYWMNFSDSVYQMIDDELEKAYSEELEEDITKMLNKAAA
jgi:hypothetical protein